MFPELEITYLPADTVLVSVPRPGRVAGDRSWDSTVEGYHPALVIHMGTYPPTC